MSFPNNRHGNTPPYLLSAYGIAVKHGYSGSEEEWLASLKGDEGEYPRLSYQIQTSGDDVRHGIFYRYADEGDWTNLCWLDDMMTAAEADIINAAKGYADLAEAYAKGTVDDEAVEEGDPGYEDNAKYYAGQASTYASAAGGFATGASNYAQAASGYATTASGHADNAAASATAAAGSASDAAGSATSASNSAGSASTSASSAQAQATQAGTYAYNADQSAQQAASYAAAANTAYGNVVGLANGVDAKVDAASAAQTAAETAATNAANSATAASGSATSAAGSATAAAGSATDASASATAAGSSATSAAGSASSAHTDAAAALEAKNTAVSAKDTAVAAKDTAVASKTAAEAARGAAETAAVNAAGSATAAANSATAAAASAATAAEVESRAEEVAESIPEDYSELSDDVVELKSAIIETAPTYYKEAHGHGRTGITGILEVEDAVARKVKSLVVDLGAVQAGSGDPSPENVREFTGWNQTVICYGKGNLFDVSQRQTGKSINSAGDIVTDDKYQISGRISLKGAKNVRYIYYNSSSGYRSSGISYYRANESFISKVGGSNTGSNKYRVETITNIPAETDYCIINVPNSTTYVAVIADYTAKGYTYESPIYGGKLDVTGGTLTLTHGYIASYGGEELPGKWASSMDVYAEGTTPTAGAQVVYELAAPVVSSVEAMDIVFAEGKNCVMAYDTIPTQNPTDLLYPCGTDRDLKADGAPADAKAVGDSLFTHELPLYPCYFWAKRAVGADGALAGNDSCVCTATLNLSAPVRVVSDDPAYEVRVYSNGAGTPYGAEWTFDRLVSARIGGYKPGGGIFSTAELSHIHVYTTYGGAQEFAENYTNKITDTRAFGAYDTDNSHISRLALIADDTSPVFGMLTSGTNYRATWCPYYSDNDMDIWVCRAGTITARIFIDGECHTIVSGQKYHVDAGKRFMVSFSTSSLDNSNYQQAVLMMVDNTVPSGFVYSTYDVGQNPAIQSAVRVGDKVIAIGSSNYSVYLIGSPITTLTGNVSLGHDTGHSNQANYSGGKVYISNWTDSTLINVFDFDDEANTLTYSKDIVIPIDETFGSTGYHVFDEEKQIYFYGWTAGRATVQYGLFVKSGETYVLSWKKTAPVPGVINGFTVQGRYIYAPNNVYISGDAWRYTNLYRIDMLTGEKQYNAYEPTGTILNHESEAIMPIGDDVFLLHMHLGNTYVQTFKAAENG